MSRNSGVFLINVVNGIRENGLSDKMPLGVLAVAGTLIDAGIKVSIFDSSLDQKFVKKFIEQVTKEKPLIIGLSVMTLALKKSIQFSKLIKLSLPETTIIWGGVHPSLFPNHVTELPCVDIFVINEGHNTTLELYQKIKNGKPIKNVNGISFVENGVYTYNKPIPVFEYDLKPFPYHLVNISEYPTGRYLEGLKYNETTEAQVVSSIGCPLRCGFCVNTARNKYKTRNLPEFLDEIERLQRDYNIHKFEFVDEFFFGDIKRVKSFLGLKKERRLKFYWRATITAKVLGKLSLEFLKELKSEGLIELLLGAESGCNRVLQLINKGITVEDIKIANGKCKKIGISVTFSFMAGIPGESFKEFMQTKDLILDLIKQNTRAHIIGPQLYRPYPDAPLTKDAEQCGYIIPETVEDWLQEMTGARFGDTCNPESFPWIKEAESFKKVIYYLFLYIGTKNLRTDLTFLNKLIRKTVNKIIEVRLKYNLYYLPIELFLYKRIYNYFSTISYKNT